MKRCSVAILIVLLICALMTGALAETYAEYEVIADGVFLTKTPEMNGLESIILSVKRGEKVLGIAEEENAILIVMENGLCGYMEKEHLKHTGKSKEMEVSAEEFAVSNRQDMGIFLIDVDEKAELFTDTGRYPRTVTLGESTHDVQKLLTLLLGDKYVHKERGEWSQSDEYVAQVGVNPWETRSVHVYDDGSIWFYDPAVSGERGGEYEPPNMNMLPDDSVLIAKGLLAAYFPNGETDFVGKARLVSERWSYADRWMTDAEYREFMYGCKLHYFNFEHRTEQGIAILGDSILASVGINGLNGFDLSWHEYEESTEEIVPMPLKDAIRMADSSRAAEATLLYANLVYSNWLTESNEYNLSWYLLTDRGTYVVDCVLNRHKCDSYEY